MPRYQSLSIWLKDKYGCRVFKVSLSAATTCPNIDGTLAKGGCTFCNDASYSPNSTRNRVFKPVPIQLEEGIDYIRQRHKTSKFIAYFQSFTSTYGPMEELLRKFEESLSHPDVIGLALSTRPDSIHEEWAKALEALTRDKLCWIELGLQTADDRTLARINRWHTRRQFVEALDLWRAHTDIPVCAHVVLGLPGEKRDQALQTARFLATQPIQGIKIHNLHVVKGTAIAKTWREGHYQPLTLDDFVSQTVDFLEQTPPHFLIHRLNAHAPRHLTLAPDWSVNKLAIFNAVEAELERRNSWQGKTLGFSQ